MKISSKSEFILYVENQAKSTEFYTQLFQMEPILNVPGMSEFQLNETTKLGLMPNSGIQKILQDKTPDPALGNGFPRCELYIFVEYLVVSFENAINYGSNLICSM